MIHFSIHFGNSREGANSEQDAYFLFEKQQNVEKKTLIFI